MNIYKYRNYKDFLKDTILNSPNNGRGIRRRFAEAAGCQLPYVSHVLNGEYHFNTEQIDGIANLLKLKQAEHEFLILLVQLTRAGTISLKNFYKKMIDEIAIKNSSIKEKIKPKDSLSITDRNIYYSEWTYSAVHILTTIPEYRSSKKIAEKLKLSISKVDSIINDLISMGLLKTISGELRTQKLDLHLEEDSIHIHNHHTNLRLKSIQALNEASKHDLHYSLTFTIHKDDLIKIREILSSAIKESAEIIRPSKEEELAILCIDLFKV